MALAVKRSASLLQQANKRLKVGVSSAIQGLQKILGPNAQPKSDGQAQALELVYAATVTQLQIIVLGTGSSKSLLFFSVAAIVSR